MTIKKKYLALIVLTFIVGLFFYKIDSIRQIAKNNFSDNSKRYLKILFFGESRVEEIQKNQNYKYMNYNQVILPETQFTNIDLKTVKLPKLYDGNKTPQTFYIDFLDDDLIIVDTEGNFFFT